MPAHETVPLVRDPRGVVRIAGTRVPLDTVVSAFQRGATAEEITQQFPAIALGDVYAVFSFIVRRRDEVDAYLRERAAVRDPATRAVEPWRTNVPPSA